MTSVIRFTAFLLILPAGASAWGAQDEGAPSDTPLSRKEHPRLLMTRSMLPALRKRCRADYSTEYGAMVRWANAEIKTFALKEWKDRTGLTDPEIRSLLALSFLWQVTRERRYTESAVTLLEVYARAVAARPWTDSQSWRTGRPTAYVPRRYFANIAVIYDLLHDVLKPEQRASIGRVILEGVGGKRNVPGMGYRLTSFLGAGKAAGVLAIHGDGIDDEAVEGLRSALTEYLHGALLPELRVVSKRRGAWNESMHCGCFEEYWLPLFWFLTNATGRNYFRSEAVLRGMGTWYVYNIFRFGAGPNSNVVPVSSIYHGGVDTKGAFGLPICAAGSGDGLTAWLVRQKWWQKNRKLLLDKLPPRDAWFKILFLDPDAKLVRPEDLPETALFEAIGWVSMRSSWKPGATFAHFKCGIWRRGEPAHLDNNSFYIYKNGPLAIDGIKPGATDDPSHPGTRLEKLVPYGRMTLAHNTITVYDPDEKIMGVSQYGWRRARRPFPVNDGGQTFRAEKRATRPERLEQGRIVAYETNRLFDYACGDATESYNPAKLKRFTRQFVFLKPDLFVVFDRVEGAKAEFPKHWLLHSYKEPEISGDTVMIDAPGEGPRTGRLFSRTILPERAKIAKYPRATLVRLGKDVTPGFWKKTEESWRIEVAPSEKRADDVFLHVLYAGDRSVEKMPPLERIERGGRVGVRLSGSKRVEVTFARSGPVSGHISIVDGDTSLVDRELADSVDDTYDGWRDDPRYGTWAARWPVFPERQARSKRPPPSRPLLIEGAGADVVEATLSGPSFHSPELFQGVEDFHNPRLKRLRSEQNLEEVVRGEENEFRRLLRLRHWVHTRWPIDNDQRFSGDAFAILERAKKGDGFHCAHSMRVQQAALTSMGYVARNLGVDSDHKKFGRSRHHGVNEVWSNEYAKWVLLDAKYDVHFEREGVPLSALEVHEAVRYGKSDDVVMVQGVQRRPVPMAPPGALEASIENYWWVSYTIRQNTFTQPHWSGGSRLVVFDNEPFRTTTWYRGGRDGLTRHWAYAAKAFVPTLNRRQIEWTPGVPRLTVRQASSGKLDVRLRSATPNFKDYQVRRDGGAWKPVLGGQLSWNLKEGRNTLEVRTRNLFGVNGPPVTATVSFRP